MSMRTRNNKNNLSQSQTNNESNNLTNYTNKNIFNKKKSRNRNDNAFQNKKTFNLSNKKYDINCSTTVLNNSNLPNFKNMNLSIKSRNKIPSCLKGRPNTVFNKNNLLTNKIKKRKIEEKIKKENNSNLIAKKRNYSMIGYGYGNTKNNLNQNLTERAKHRYTKEVDNINFINSYINKSKNKNKDEKYKRTRNSKALSGLQINLSNLEHLSKNEIKSERNKNIKNNHNRNMSQNEITSIFLKNNLLNKKKNSKLSFINSNSVSKSKSKSKNKSKVSHFQKIKKRSKLANSLKTLLIEDTSKWKKIGRKSNNILDNKKISKDKNLNLMKKKSVNNNNISMNNNEQSSYALTSRTRNLKSYNILFRTNSLEIDKNKINEINNKENQSINKKKNNYENSKISQMKKIAKKSITKNHTEKTLYDSSFIYNGFKKYTKKLKKK